MIPLAIILVSSVKLVMFLVEWQKNMFQMNSIAISYSLPSQKKLKAVESESVLNDAGSRAFDFILNFFCSCFSTFKMAVVEPKVCILNRKKESIEDEFMIGTFEERKKNEKQKSIKQMKSKAMQLKAIKIVISIVILFILQWLAFISFFPTIISYTATAKYMIMQENLKIDYKIRYNF